MCGGFAAVAADRQPRAVWGITAYNLGRLTTYCAIGLIAGMLGRSLDTWGVSLTGVARLSAVVLGSFLIGYGFLRLVSGNRENAVSRGFHRVLARVYPQLAARVPTENPVVRAFGIGLLSTFLPCGWLYGFAAIAATTGDPFAAVFVMCIFWVGTLPMLVGLGSFARSILTRWGAQIPAITSALLIVAGFFSIAGHLGFTGNHQHSHGLQIEKLHVPESKDRP